MVQLYHGTSRSRAGLIKSDGFSGETGENCNQCDHRETTIGKVFLTDDISYAKSYARSHNDDYDNKEAIVAVDVGDFYYQKYEECDGFAIPIEIINDFPMKIISGEKYEEIDDYVF